MLVRCLHCHEPIEVPDEGDLSHVNCSACGGSFSLVGETTAPYAGEKTRKLAHFELLEQVGVGAFGSVWKARDTRLDRIVAVKVPRASHLEGDEAEMFLREARAAAQLAHAGIVPVHEVGREDETLYIVSDFVQGATLDDWLTTRRLSPREAAELCLQIAEALEHAHDQGVIHRDLKPGNIMMDLCGRPHLMDFGLARRAGREATMTVEGRVLGTPAYMSPEQARGEAHTADHRTDIYSLGVVLFRLLTGELPFRGSSQMLFVQILKDEPPSPRKLNSHIPRDLETICLKCLEKDPDKRYASAAALAEDLRHFLAGEPITARPISRTARAWRWCKRNPNVARLGLALVLTLLIGVSTVTGLWIGANQIAEARRRQLYVSDMYVAMQALEDGNLNRVTEVLRRNVPRPDEKDLRRFEWYHLWHLCDVSNRCEAIDVQQMPVSVALDGGESDGRIAIGHAHGALTLRRMDDLNRVDKTLRTEGGSFSTFVLFSPDGQFLAYPDTDSRSLILQSMNGAPTSGPLVQGGHFRAAVFSSDSKCLATINLDGSRPEGMATVWDLRTCVPIKKLPLGNMEILKRNTLHTRSIAFSPDGTLLALATAQGEVRLWDWRSDQEDATTTLTATTVNAQDRRVYCVAFSPRGTRIAAAMGDGTVRVWDRSVPAKPTETILAGHSQPVYCVAFSPQGELLASSGSDGKLKLWNAETLNEVRSLNAHSDAVVDLCFSKDGRTLVSAGLDYHIRFWPVEARAEQDRYGDSDRHGKLLFLDDRTVGSLSDSRFQTWRLDGSRAPHAPDFGEDVQCIAIKRNGVLAAVTKRSVMLWKVGETKPAQILTPLNSLGFVPQSPPTLISFSHDGSTMGLGSTDGTVVVWNMERRAPVKLARVPALKSLAISPDGRVLATISSGTNVMLWETESGCEKPSLTGPRDRLSCVAFSPDGELLAAGGYDNSVWLWRWQSETEGRHLDAHSASVGSFCFLETGSTLFSGDSGGVVFVWDTEAMEPRYKITADRGKGLIAVSPSGRILAASESEGPFQVWRAATDEEIEAATWWSTAPVER